MVMILVVGVGGLCDGYLGGKVFLVHGSDLYGFHGTYILVVVVVLINDHGSV